MSAIRQSIGRAAMLAQFPKQCETLVLCRNISTTKTTSGLGVAPVEDKDGNMHSSFPVPNNVEELNAAKKAQFSPKRSRDLNAAQIKTMQPGSVFSGGLGDQTVSQIAPHQPASPDCHMGKYDCNNSVSLSSVMQSNVPTPFETRGTETQVHLAMPGGQWSQGEKYIADDLHTTHHCKLHLKKTGTITSPPNLLGVSSLSSTNSCCLQVQPFIFNGKQCYSTLASAFKECLPLRSSPTHCLSHLNRFHASASSSKDQAEENDPPALTPRQKLKRAVKDYGSTVMVFHISMGLASVAFWYIVVSSGIDMVGLFEKFGVNIMDGAKNSGEIKTSEVMDEPQLGQSVETVAAGVSTFVLAYAIHKLTAPARIGLTLGATPLIVRHLRKIGFLKTPK